MRLLCLLTLNLRLLTCVRSISSLVWPLVCSQRGHSRERHLLIHIRFRGFRCGLRLYWSLIKFVWLATMKLLIRLLFHEWACPLLLHWGSNVQNFCIFHLHWLRSLLLDCFLFPKNSTVQLLWTEHSRLSIVLSRFTLSLRLSIWSRLKSLWRLSRNEFDSVLWLLAFLRTEWRLVTHLLLRKVCAADGLGAYTYSRSFFKVRCRVLWSCKLLVVNLTSVVVSRLCSCGHAFTYSSCSLVIGLIHVVAAWATVMLSSWHSANVAQVIWNRDSLLLVSLSAHPHIWFLDWGDRLLLFMICHVLAQQ